jgi:hypothetical protein
VLDFIFSVLIGGAFALLVAFVRACHALGADPGAASDAP